VRKPALSIAVIFLAVSFSLGAPKPSPAETSEAPVGTRLPELIDTPTAEVIDQYAYLTSFRFYQKGGVITQAIFGIYPRLNFGFALDTEGLIGSSTQAVRVNRPSLNVKWNFFDGRDVFPAIAVGYDSLGHHYDTTAGEYAQREKGLYLVGTKQIFTPGFQIHGGINTYKFSSGNEIHGFVSSSYSIRDAASVFAEIDNIGSASQTRYNIGFRFFVNPSFSVDADLRNGKNEDPPDNNDSRRTDRELQLNYLGSF
jgi:hypothetical protein